MKTGILCRVALIFLALLGVVMAASAEGKKAELLSVEGFNYILFITGQCYGDIARDRRSVARINASEPPEIEKFPKCVEAVRRWEEGSKAITDLNNWGDNLLLMLDVATEHEKQQAAEILSLKKQIAILAKLAYGHPIP